MPYSTYTVSDRKAVAQLKYQIRRFMKQAEACGTDPKQLAALKALGNDLYFAAAGCQDFDDDGTPLDYPAAPDLPPT